MIQKARKFPHSSIISHYPARKPLKHSKTLNCLKTSELPVDIHSGHEDSQLRAHTLLSPANRLKCLKRLNRLMRAVQKPLHPALPRHQVVGDVIVTDVTLIDPPATQ